MAIYFALSVMKSIKSYEKGGVKCQITIAHQRTVEEDDARYDLYCDAVYYPSDCAHPAEYIGPLCPVCGEEMSEYTCDICGKPGMPVDEVLAEDGKYLICHECKAKMIFLSGKPIEEIKKEI